MKIRVLSLLIVTALVFLTFASCKQENVNLTSGDDSSLDLNHIESSNTEISDSVSFDTTEREIEFKDYYFGGRFDFDEQDYMIRYAENELAVFVVDGNDDISVLLSMLEFGGDEINKFFSEQPENYFNEHILLVNDFTNGSLGLRRDVGRVFVDENGVTVEYIYESPEEAADLVEPRIVFVELNKADVFGCQRFNGISHSSSFTYDESE